MLRNGGGEQEVQWSRACVRKISTNMVQKTLPENKNLSLLSAGKTEYGGWTNGTTSQNQAPSGSHCRAAIPCRAGKAWWEITGRVVHCNHAGPHTALSALPLVSWRMLHAGKLYTSWLTLRSADLWASKTRRRLFSGYPLNLFSSQSDSRVNLFTHLATPQHRRSYPLGWIRSAIQVSVDGSPLCLPPSPPPASFWQITLEASQLQPWRDQTSRRWPWLPPHRSAFLSV